MQKNNVRLYVNILSAYAENTAHNKDNLIVITGSQSIIAEFNNYQKTMVQPSGEIIHEMISL